MRLLLTVGSDCAHILPLLDVVSTDACHVLVHPRMRCDLETARQAAAWRVGDTVAVYAQLVMALAHLDDHGVCSGDLSKLFIFLFI